MSDFDGDPEPIHVFVFDHTYVFKHYFELNDLFSALSAYYDDAAYRFEVPTNEWDAVAPVLREYAYEPVVVETPEEFVVVKEQYTKHAEILKHSVEHWSRRGYNFFLMKDPLSVERAVQEQGATPVVETGLVAGL